MKEFILLNYNLKTDKIYNDYFFVDDEIIRIVRVKYTENVTDLEILFMLSNELYYKNIPVDTFILNKKGKFYTQKNDEYIILVKNNDIDDIVNLNYLKKFNMPNNLKYKNIIDEWQMEIDDLEEKLIEYDKECKIVQKTANYYIGMAENAILLLNENKNINNNSIGIKLNPVKVHKSDINNPFNYFKINKMYNVATYIKNRIFTNKVDYNELDQIIKEIENKNEEMSLFAYMLYPDYYIDIVKNEINEKQLKKIVSFIVIYEKVLVYLKENMKKNNKLKLFVWLN